MPLKILITAVLFYISLHAFSQLTINPVPFAGKGFRDFSVSVLNGTNLLQNSDLASWGVLGKSKLTPGFDVTIHPSYQLTHVVALGLVYQVGRTNQYSADWLGKTTYHGISAMGDLNLSGLFPRVDAHLPYIWALHFYGGVGMLGYKAYRKPKQLFDSAPDSWALITDKKLNNRSVYSQLGLGVLYKLNPNIDLEFRAMYVMTGDETFDGSGDPVPGRYTPADINPDRNDNMMTFSLGISYKIGKQLEHLRWFNPLRKMYETNNALAEEVKKLKSIVEKGRLKEPETQKTGDEKDSLEAKKKETRIELIAPANGFIVSADKPGGEQEALRQGRTVFSWQGFTTLQQNLVYRLKMVEVTDGQTPAQAFGTNKPFFEKDTVHMLHTNKPFFEKDSLPMLTTTFTAGKTYAWAIQLMDTKKNILQTSEVRSFSMELPQESVAIQLTAPANGAVISPRQQVTFKWLPPVPMPEGGGYRITIVEVGKGQTPAQAFGTNKPFFEKDTFHAIVGNKPFFEKDTPVFNYPKTAPPFAKGKTYVWGVAVINLDGKPIGKRSSAPFSFSNGGTMVPGDKQSVALLYPTDGSVVSADQPLVFTWLHGNTGSGKGALYKIRIVEAGNGQTAAQAYGTNKPFFEKDTFHAITGNKPFFEKDTFHAIVGNKPFFEKDTFHAIVGNKPFFEKDTFHVITGNKPFFEKDTVHMLQTNMPFFEKDTMHCVYPANAPKLQNGKTYVWNIEAFDAGGTLVATSKPKAFTFKKVAQ